MKKLLTISLMLLTLGSAAFAIGKAKKEDTVVFKTSIDCKNCVKKVVENVSFEKGVTDLDADLRTKNVTITFDAAKTDTLNLAKAIRKLGYTADVVKFIQ